MGKLTITGHINGILCTIGLCQNSYWKWPSQNDMNFPLNNGDFPVRYVNVYQRVVGIDQLVNPMSLCLWSAISPCDIQMNVVQPKSWTIPFTKAVGLISHSSSGMVTITLGLPHDSYDVPWFCRVIYPEFPLVFTSPWYSIFPHLMSTFSKNNFEIHIFKIQKKEIRIFYTHYPLVNCYSSLLKVAQSKWHEFSYQWWF